MRGPPRSTVEQLEEVHLAISTIISMQSLCTASQNGSQNSLTRVLGPGRSWLYKEQGSGVVFNGPDPYKSQIQLEDLPVTPQLPHLHVHFMRTPTSRLQGPASSEGAAHWEYYTRKP
ncbi:UNVERIFIED_CONTAM: hypothetical protein FKN15_063480 [Acipenser sinensis]